MKERRREKEKERKRDENGTTGGGAEGQKRFLQGRQPPQQWGDQLGQNASTGDYKRRAQQLVNGAEQSETFTAGLCPSLRCVSTGTDGGYVLKHGFGKQIQKGDCCRLQRDSLRAQE